MIVFSTVSMSHPSITLVVDQHASPLSNFLTDAGSLCWGCSVSSNGANTWSMALRRTGRTRVRSRRPPWHRPKKSSTYTST